MAKPEKKPAGKDAAQPASGKKEVAQPAKKVTSKTGAEIRGIVRIAGRDLKGEFVLGRALSRVKGVGERLGPVITEVVARELRVPMDMYVGELSEEQIERVESIMSEPQKYGVPAWMLNRRKDTETGVDKHLIGANLTFTIQQDIEREKNVNSWRGYRHNYGQKVRGQHTRTTGRQGMTVGVLRKSIMAKQGAAQAPASGTPAAATPAKKEEKK